MAQAAAKVETAEPEVVAEAKPVEINPKHVMPDNAGHCWRTVMVRMPEGAVADDLRNPKIWRRVQADRGRALIKYDHLFILTFDEGQFAEAIVSHATGTEATLVIKKTARFREQAQTFFADENYRVIWDGAGYTVERKSDEVRMGGSFANEGLAIAHLRSLYSKQVA